jgi:gamma-glutamyltranspeptidase
VNVEKWFSPDTITALQKMGHHVQIGLHEQGGGYWSDAECIEIDGKTGDRLGASDGRNNGKAVGY